MSPASEDPPQQGALAGLTVLDLSRVLAGPTATQLLGDLGATVIKIENPATGGDDTRAWGPPFVAGADGAPTDLSAYFMAANRNKFSVAADLATAEGQRLIRALADRADVVVENFKPGGLAKYGLDPESLMRGRPGLVVCSISGFGQTGPNRDKPGYDLMAQGLGGIMSLTGPVEGPPMKVGVAVADVVCGLYATVGILAALHHRERTGEGQHIDLALADSQMAWLVNEGVSHLVTGRDPVRRGNDHPTIVPYGVFPTADGHLILAVGNDGQFRRCCAVLERPALADDPRFATNPARLEHRATLIADLAAAFAARGTEEWIAALEAAGVPAGPIRTVAEALSSPQAQARGMVVSMPAPETAEGTVRLLGNPLRLSRTPVTYRRAPPGFGADTEEIRRHLLEDP